MNDATLHIDGLNRSFRIGSMLWGKRIMAVDDVTLSLGGDEPWILSIVGESGSGKTTLGRMILGLLEPSGGDIGIGGRSIRELGKAWPRGEFYKEVQPIFQNPFSAFNMHRKVDAYLFDTALRVAGKRDRAEAERTIAEMLNAIGMELSQVRGKYPNQFSGGELQRIAIARALIPNPKLIIADEPVAMIDASLRMNVVNLFKSLKEKFKTRFVYITHDLSTAYYVSDRLAVMYRGQIIEQGGAKDVLAAPAHPYTRLLLDSIPKVGEKWDEQVALPDLEEREYAARSCKFAPRCPHATDLCRAKMPGRTDLGGGHSALCFKLSNFQ